MFVCLSELFSYRPAKDDVAANGTCSNTTPKLLITKSAINKPNGSNKYLASLLWMCRILIQQILPREPNVKQYTCIVYEKIKFSAKTSMKLLS